MSRKNEKKLEPLKPDPSFYLGEKISYKGNNYEVIGLLTNRKLHMENLSTGQRFKLDPLKDTLYKNLVNVKIHEELLKENKTQPELSNTNQSKKIKR